MRRRRGTFIARRRNDADWITIGLWFAGSLCAAICLASLAIGMILYWAGWR